MSEGSSDIGQKSQHSTYPPFVLNFDSFIFLGLSPRVSERIDLPDLLIIPILLLGTSSTVLLILAKFFELPHLQQESYHLLTKYNNVTKELWSFQLLLRLHLRRRADETVFSPKQVARRGWDRGEDLPKTDSLCHSLPTF